MDPHSKDSTRLPWWLRGKESACQGSTWVWSLVQEDSTCHRATTAIESVLQSRGMATTEPKSCNYLSPCTLEPVLYNKKSRFSKKPTHCT